MGGMGIVHASSHPPEAKLYGRHILVCLDRSPFSEVCLPYAISLARTFGSAITLVHVMQPHHEHAGPHTHDALGWEIARQEARAYLTRVELEVSRAVERPVLARLEQGRAAERIVDLAREISADLTMLGSHGEGASAPRHLGSTVQRVLSLSRGSVFIARAGMSAPAIAAPKHILVPLDGSLRTESVLPAAARIASAHGGDMLLVHVVQEPLPTALLQSIEDLELARTLATRLETGAKRYLEHLQQQLAHEVGSVRTIVVRSSHAYQCLLEVSQREQSDLIVLSAHGSACDSARAFGNVTGYLLTHATAPLLVLQDLPEEDRPRTAQRYEAQLAPTALRASYAPESA